MATCGPPTPALGNERCVAQDRRSTEPAVHPFAHSTNLLEIIRDDHIDVEAEARLYDDMTYDSDASLRNRNKKSRDSRRRRKAPPPPIDTAPSVFSKEIFLGDNSGSSLAFARDVQISGWTNVGDELSGAYVVYDCVIKTKEGTIIHAHKRYSAFAQFDNTLRQTLPVHLHPPSLPPKHALARYRPAFLSRRRIELQHWLSSVLLHPEVGASRAAREWVME